MEIRRIKNTDDRFFISRIYEASWKYAYHGIIPQTYLDSIPPGKWAANIDKPGLYSMVVIEDVHFIGTASFCRSRDEDFADFGEVVSIYFLPEYIGKGYGKKLLDAVMKELQGLGFKDVFLWVLEENRRARSFYEKFGFTLGKKVLSDTIGGKSLRELQYIYHIN